jgi:RNA polymerase sigma factor (sigma-70 family)
MDRARRVSTDPLIVFGEDPEDPKVAEKEYSLLRAKLIHYFAGRYILDPEDLADEVLARAFRRLSDGSEVVSSKDITQFAYGIAAHVMSEQRRRRTVDELSSVDPKVPARFGHAENIDAAVLAQALRKLPEEQRLLLISYFSEGLATLAQRLGTNPKALRLRVYRLLNSLRQRVLERTP